MLEYEAQMCWGFPFCLKTCQPISYSETLLLPTCGSQEDETWTWKLSGVNVAKNHSGKDDGKGGHPGPEYELLTLAFGLFAASFFFFQSVGDLPLLYCLVGRRASSNLPNHWRPCFIARFEFNLVK